VPPEIVGAIPPDLSIETGPLDSMQLRFSEPVAKETVLEAFRSLPSRLIRRAVWTGDTLLTLHFWDPLPADSSVSIFLEPGWLDLRGVAQREWRGVDFSTGSRLLRGWVGGTVDFKRRPSENLHVVLEDSASTWTRRERPDRQGEFFFRQVATDSLLLRLWAFEDVDGDSLFDPAADFADTLSDSLLLSDLEPHRLGLLLNVIDPDEPGKLSGLFSSTDSLEGLHVIRLIADSLRADGDSIPPGHFPRSWPDSLKAILAGQWEGPALLRKREGDFTISGVPPGPWAFFIHRDVDEDSLWNVETEAAWLDPGPLWIEPGATLNLPEFRFPEPPDSVVSDSLEIEGEAP